MILSIIGNIFLKWLGMERKQKIESENEALKGRADSVEESFSEQNKAQKDAEKAKEEIKKQGDDNDVFGASEWNEKDEPKN